jgi:hypothetical protein
MTNRCQGSNRSIILFLELWLDYFSMAGNFVLLGGPVENETMADLLLRAPVDGGCSPVQFYSRTLSREKRSASD